MGHAIEFFQADAYARYFRKKLNPENVFFNLGVDEHGQKLLTTATANNQSPQDFLDTLVPKWEEFCYKFHISYDTFYRTATPDHAKGVKEIWSHCENHGDIYKKYYEGYYCVGCEAFLLERDLVDRKCPNHGTVPQYQAEENFFFRLSNYSEQLLKWLDENPNFLKPASKFQELRNFIKDILDISISRNRAVLPWGIETPSDSNHTVYVWFDALSNYIQTVGYGTDQNTFDKWWPAVQICGPDNLRFQGAIWQGILAALGLPQTKKLLVHGTILGPDNQKMSKSRGNVVSPLDQYEKYGSDLTRFYMLGSLRTYGDTSYRETDLVEQGNTFLSNNYGNLLNRLIHLGNKKNIDINDHQLVDENFKVTVQKFIHKVESYYETFELFDAVATINELLSFGNQYIHEQEPWKKDISEAKIILCNIAHLLLEASDLLEPIIPEGAVKAIEAIKKQEKIILFPRIDK